MLVGTDNGLFKLDSTDAYIPLWTGGKVKQIVHTNQRWYFLTSEGILTSIDLTSFVLKNTGLTALTIEKYENKQITLTKEIQDLKDLCVNPLNPQELVTATKDAVFITRDGGETWKSLGSVSSSTSGIKAVAIATIEDKVVVFMSHAILGFAYMLPDEAQPSWREVSGGFKIMDSLSTPDEISDILPLFRTAADGTPYVEIYIAQTFLPYIYRFDWSRKRAECIYMGREPSDTIDSLTHVEDALLFTQPGTINAFDYKSKTVPGNPAKLNEWKRLFSYAPSAVNTAWIPRQRSGFTVGFSLCELWMLTPQTILSPYKTQITGKKSIYVPPYQVRKQAGMDGINKFRNIIKNNKLNSLVIDMKDDYGLLRYESRDPLVMEKASVSSYATDLDLFISEFKKENIYLIARIVVFKDRNLSRYAGGKYAVWDARNNAPWVGIKGLEDVIGADGNPTGAKKTAYYDENWVDPYSPEVWEYDVAIAKELVARGFDEIQFDYIRFPTDGTNLGNATYRWKQKGMDKESALMSFLSYARQNIHAPISIDIYGANGWYRSGTRTGQDVEMLAKYVDVIAPMFYPSHFENAFMNYAPYPDRPYRIYFYGTYRNTVIGRNHIVVRPWVQAFYLGVRYDKQYYGPDYVQKEIFGVRDSVNRGYMYWNNSGNYDTLQPDIGDAPYTGSAQEASTKYRKPTFSSDTKNN
ncbi:MAG: hypothetical protein K6E51_03775 [Treponema sp.]|nr:hypothetical protein [Treponema sp.]